MHIRVTLLVLVMLAALSSRSFATTCTAANPNDNNPDDQALNTCLTNLGPGGVLNLVHGNPGYILTHTVNVPWDGISIVGDGLLANFIARSDMVGYMLSVQYVDNITLQNLWFDGNKSARVGTCNSANGTGKNLVINSDSFVMDSVGSVSAVCGSGA